MPAAEENKGAKGRLTKGARLPILMAWHTGDVSWANLAPPLAPLPPEQASELKAALAGFRLFRERMPLERRAA